MRLQNDGDISISSMKVTFTITNASGSDNPNDYADKCFNLDGNKRKVGKADARISLRVHLVCMVKNYSDFKRFIVRADRTEKNSI